MRGFIKLLLILGLISFSAYTFYVEPNAADDPAGAISKAAERLTTICERNREECDFIGDAGNGIAQTSSIVWKVVTGEGRLVYVSNNEDVPRAGLGDRNNNGSHNDGPSLGDLIRSTTLFGGGRSSDGGDRPSNNRSSSSWSGSEKYRHYCN